MVAAGGEILLASSFDVVGEAGAKTGGFFERMVDVVVGCTFGGEEGEEEGEVA